MSNLATDTFTDSDFVALTSHTPDSGGSWSSKHGATNAQIINFQVVGDGTSGVYAHSATPASADYSVQADLHSIVASSATGFVCARVASTGNCYMFGYGAWASGHWGMWKLDWSASNTELATSAVTLADATTYTIRLEATGSSSVTLKGYVNNSLVITYTDSSSPYTSANSPGLWIEVAQGAALLDNFTADTIAAAAKRSGLTLLGAG